MTESRSRARARRGRGWRARACRNVCTGWGQERGPQLAAKLIPAGTDIAVNVHYTPNGSR
jgi:hypothetical protein